MENSWKRMKSWLKTNAAHIVDELNGPATDEELLALEQQLNLTLPQEYKSFLKIHNGQDRDSEGLIDTEELLSTERVLEEWTVWKDLLDNGDFDDSQSDPDEGVKEDWWNPKWVPITYDGSGNHYCLDLDPAPGGTSGQIIRMWHDSGERELLADSFAEWIEDYTDQWEEGVYMYSEDWGGIINKEEADE